MKFKKALSALALGVAAVGAAPAYALPTIINTDGPITFSGFDWAQGGTAFTTDFTAQTNSVFNITYFAQAAGLSLGADNIEELGIDTTANGLKRGGAGSQSYEYTIIATLQERVVGPCVAGAACNFQSLGGTWAVYYDTAANASATPGTGYYDGIKILGGTLTTGISSGGFTASTPGNGGGSSNIFGKVTFQDTNYVVGALSDIVLGTTLQQGTSITNPYPRSGFDPSAAPGTISFTTPPLSTSPTFQLLQADGNLSFVAVPEPNALALVGVAMAAGAFVTRRRKSKQQ